MTEDQKRWEELKNDPALAINMIIDNNPMAVAQRGIDLGLFTYLAQPQELFDAVVTLVRQGDQGTAAELLNVPFNPRAVNTTALYGPMLKELNGRLTTLR